MSVRSRERVSLVCSILLLIALGGCASANQAAAPVELTLATFNEFGYENLIADYQAEHPEIRIVHRRTATAQEHHERLLTSLNSGGPLADVEAVEEGWMGAVLRRTAQFHDLNKIGPPGVTRDRWLQWKADAASTLDDELIGYGTDIGPMAMCYRRDLLEAAGLPTDPEAIRQAFASWDSYFATGNRFAAQSGMAWFDSASQVFNAMANQNELGYFDRDDKLVVDRNPDLRSDWDRITRAVSQRQSAKVVAFTDDWNAALRESKFATRPCPSWMIGLIEQQAGPVNKNKWAVTASFPDGAGNWGGSFLTVPRQTAHPKEAAALAAWLTAPQQQTRAFRAKGAFPSQYEALLSPELLNRRNSYFGDIKVGAVFAEQAQKVQSVQHKGPQSGQIQDKVFAGALKSVEDGTSPEAAWNTAVEAARKLVG